MPRGWSEEATTFAEVKEQIWRFQDERGWTAAHSPKNIAMSIAVESAELMEIFQWVDTESALSYARDDPERFLHVRQEVADVVIYCMTMATALGFDLAAAIDEKIDNNASRYPVGERGPLAAGRGEEG